MRTFRVIFALLSGLIVVSLASTPACAEIVYLYDSCAASKERGVAVAKQDIARGKLRIKLYWGAAPVPPGKNEVQETNLRVKFIESFGVEATAIMASDIVDCVSFPYESAYQGEMKRAIEAKHGKDFWRQIDKKVMKTLGRKLVKSTDEIT